MILTRLTLRNVGAYRGKHSLDLTPSPGKPILLVGALNGSGKTTLLESIQLALYGRSTLHLVRDASGYSDYLSSLINRHVAPRDGASVTLEFTQSAAGRQTHYAVCRTWSASGNGVREDLSITRNGTFDSEASERWIEIINALLPVQIADLFLFDGERIEALANPESSSTVLRTGVHALLGLDLVDNLSRSMLQLERRLQRNAATPEDSSKIAQLEAGITADEARRVKLVTEAAELQNSEDSADKAVANAKERLRAEGGDLLATRDDIQEQFTECLHELDAVEAELRELAADSMPLLLVPHLVAESARFLASSQLAHTDGVIQERLDEKRQALADSLRDVGLPATKIDRLLHVLKSVLTSDEADREIKVWRHLMGRPPPGAWIDTLGALNSAAASATERWNDATEKAARAELRMAAIPADETIQHLTAAVDKAESQRAACRDARDRIRAECEAIERKLARDREQLEVFYRQHRDVDRVVVHSRRALGVLEDFRLEVAARKLNSLEDAIAENFQRLIRKRRLIRRVHIDAATYELNVLGDDEKIIPPTRLSAGERQLLAVAVLWSLAQASGRKLPIVIDTPLGRLDSVHRGQLVDNYFPHASHQVLLLSTDEEVRGDYYDRLRPFVSRQYLITHDEADRTSAFEDGYFTAGLAA